MPETHDRACWMEGVQEPNLYASIRGEPHKPPDGRHPNNLWT
jgi:hypothetical protein